MYSFQGYEIITGFHTTCLSGFSFPEYLGQMISTNSLVEYKMTKVSKNPLVLKEEMTFKSRKPQVNQTRGSSHMLWEVKKLHLLSNEQLCLQCYLTTANQFLLPLTCSKSKRAGGFHCCFGFFFFCFLMYHYDRCTES